MKRKDVLVVDALRAPVGSGRAKDSVYSGLIPQGLAAQVLDASFKKTKIPPEAIDVFRLGSVVSLKSESFKQAPAKEIALRAGMFNASASVAEKACSSALKAIHEAENAIRYEKAELAIGMGLDMMSGVPDSVNIQAVTDPLLKKFMAELSDQKARELGITREEYDKYADESYARAKKHLCDYSIDGYVAPISFTNTGGVVVNTDQNLLINERFLEKMKSKLIGGCEITTPYNASKYADACAKLTLASPRAAKKYHLEPLAKLLAYAEHTEREPKDFICGPVGAVKKAAVFAKIPMCGLESFWVNEAFPGSPLYFIDAVPEALWENVNPWGGAIAFGHALGATGAVLSVNAICQARREKKKYVAVSLCNAIAEATAMIFEIL